MKLDVNVLRYLSREDFRVLTAVEMGQKNVRQGGGWSDVVDAAWPTRRPSSLLNLPHFLFAARDRAVIPD